VSLFRFLLGLYMLLGCVFLSSLSLGAECPLCFSSVAIVFEYFFGAVGFCPTGFSGWGVLLVDWPCREPCLFDDILWYVACAVCSLYSITLFISIPEWR